MRYYVDALERCIVCYEGVDTREVEDGGDAEGCQLKIGGWVCSPECYDVVVPE